MATNTLFKTTVLILILFSVNNCRLQGRADIQVINKSSDPDTAISPFITQPSDTFLYLKKMMQLANGDRSGLWPARAAYPGEGAIFPYKRVVAYYGNFYSTQMGVLGQYPPQQMLEKLKKEVKAWEMADSLTPVMPAIHYIAVTAQPCKQFVGKCRLRMPEQQIDKSIALARQLNGIVFLDIQVGQSTLQEEIPLLKKYLQMPQVHLGIDPEFSMKQGQRPGTAIGTFDAADVNYAVEFLAALVKQFNLPPKILVVHRFTNPMLTNYKQIKTCKEVQLVINMDGFGFPAKKKNTYYHCIYKEPVQFAGFKLFYRNDTESAKQLMQPADILQLKPRPIYIQYQ
ncbi:MAG: hypothetical protein ACKOU7_05170 [Ferruginibacter sp.]